MKKQFLYAAFIFLIAFCLGSLNGNNIKACDSNVAACFGEAKKTVKEIPESYSEDIDTSFDTFMNPFVHL